MFNNNHKTRKKVADALLSDVTEYIVNEYYDEVSLVYKKATHRFLTDKIGIKDDNIRDELSKIIVNHLISRG